MSRTYSNFLLFEDVIDGMPEGSTLVKQAVSMLLNPMVTVVEEDCNTFLGKIVETTNELQGYIEVATKEPLTITRITELLAAGSYFIGIRTLHTCQSYKLGGICRMCQKSSNLGIQTNTPLGTSAVIASMLVYQTDIIRGDGFNSTFELSETSDDWYDVAVIKQGHRLVKDVDYTLGFNSITFMTTPGIDVANDTITVHFLKQNTDPFLGYIAKTYSGALLGLLALPTLDTYLRETLYENMLSDNFVSLVLEEVSALKAVPSTYKDFLERVHGKMERLLLALYLYAIYANVEV
jgi:hypothetical protein